jgi:hypothetical protein
MTQAFYAHKNYEKIKIKKKENPKGSTDKSLLVS